MRIVECEVCGLRYVVPDDNREHAQWHKKFLALNERYVVPRFGPYLWAYRERERNKRRAYEDGDHERRVYAWFCRSVIACGKFTHPDFEAYSALMSEGGSLHARGKSYWDPVMDRVEFQAKV